MGTYLILIWAAASAEGAAPAAPTEPETAAEATTNTEDAEPAERVDIVVLNLVAEHGISEGIVRLLNEILLTDFERSKRFRVMGGSDLQAMLDQEQQKQLAGCTDTSCLAELGGALGAQFLAVSNIGRIGDYYVLNVKILNTQTGNVVERFSTQVEGMENKLMAAIHAGVSAVTGEHLAPIEGEAELATHVETQGDEASELSPGPFIAGGVALVAAGIGAVLASQVAGLADVSPSDPGYSAAFDSANSMALGANISFGLAGAAAVVAVVLLALDLSSAPSAPTEESAQIVPVVTPQGAAVLVLF